MRKFFVWLPPFDEFVVDYLFCSTLLQLLGKVSNFPTDSKKNCKKSKKSLMCGKFETIRVCFCSINEKLKKDPQLGLPSSTFLMNYRSINLIQSIGKVSKLPTYSKKRWQRGKKPCSVKTNSLNCKFFLAFLTFFILMPRTSPSAM